MKKNKTACENCESRMSGVFCDLDSAELSNISEHKVTNVYKKGQNLFVQGNHPYGLYCVSRGNIKVSKVGADGKESIVRIVKGGDVIGHRSLFTDQNYTATATAMEDSTVCFLDKKFIMKAIQEMPSVAMNIIEKLSRDMGAAENKVSSFHQKNVRERLAELLLLLKESHGEETEDGHIKINIKLTREEMATMIGTANETLIRFISEFKDEGLIEQDGKFIIIKDEDELMNWADANY
ncbi:MAG: Crp/Fnr family transcriptional regulator [Deltaproteobacteria bacterium]|nr:MAG: Crp/Fnr family transcriptional regulator [Deltaproteobacteria bacterium]TNF28431.1 MAG: Crp/Fnr family transcriptional regulator [Deltaproteobacteria bacterium]